MARHGYSLENRERMELTGVLSVLRFDEAAVLLETEEGKLHVEGKNLHVLKMDLETGIMQLSGRIDRAAYEKKKDQRTLIERFFG